MKKIVGMLLRVSTKSLVGQKALAHQEVLCQHFAEQQGYTIARTYRLDGVSTKGVLSHPTFMRLRADVGSGRINALILPSLDRLARDRQQLLELRDFFRSHHVTLLPLLVIASPTGRLPEHFKNDPAGPAS